MPLLDHFRPPLSAARHWESFHAAWATEIMRTLNRSVLPEGYFAEAQVHVGGRIEIDVATFEEERLAKAAEGNGGVAVQTWAPPATTLVMPAVFPDEIEVQILETTGGPTLVAAVEFVSPRNKDRPEARRAFTAKCLSYLSQGVGLVVVDIVTPRQTNLHDELVDLMQQAEAFRFPAPTPLYVTAYRPRRRDTTDEIEMWLQPLRLGEKLPTVPLALRRAVTVPLELDTTYTQVCQDSRL